MVGIRRQALRDKTWSFDDLMANVSPFFVPTLETNSKTHDTDWDTVIELAVYHGIMPLLYHALRCTAEIHAVAPAGMSRLRLLYLAHAASSEYQATQLLEIVDCLAAGGVDCIHVKGPGLARQAFGDTALRRSNDLDILCRFDDLVRAHEALTNMGFRPGMGGPAKPQNPRSCQRIYHRKSILLEVHWGIPWNCEPYPDLTEHVWQHRTTISVGKGQISIPSPEDAFLFACVHGYRHGWGSLKFVCDVAALVTQCSGMDWEYVVHKAASLRVSRIVAVNLEICDQLLGVEAPTSVNWSVKHKAVQRVARSAIRGLQKAFRAPHPPVWRREFLHLMAIERVSDRMWHTRRLMEPSATDRAWIVLPHYLWFLYWGLRPLRVTLRYAVLRPRKEANRPASSRGR